MWISYLVKKITVLIICCCARHTLTSRRSFIIWTLAFLYEEAIHYWPCTKYPSKGLSKKNNNNNDNNDKSGKQMSHVSLGRWGSSHKLPRYWRFYALSFIGFSPQKKKKSLYFLSKDFTEKKELGTKQGGISLVFGPWMELTNWNSITKKMTN